MGLNTDDFGRGSGVAASSGLRHRHREDWRCSGRPLDQPLVGVVEPLEGLSGARVRVLVRVHLVLAFP